MTVANDDAVPWATLLPTVLLPNVVYGIGQGAALPAVPLAALEMSGSAGIAAFVAAALGIGQALTALPSGWLVETIGERRAMLLSTLVTGIGGTTAYLVTDLVGLIVGAVLIGSGVAVFTMARHAWITVEVPVAARGRSLAAVAGSTRLGMFVGPFAAGLTVHLTGSSQAAFAVVVASALVLLCALQLIRLPPSSRPIAQRHGVMRTMWQRRRVLLSVGLTVSIITTMRNARRVLVPVVGVVVGFDPVTVALLVGVASGVDFAVFYAGGVIADRWGRAAVAVSTLITFAIGQTGFVLALLGIAVGPMFIGSMMLMALANGVSGGIVPTIGSDLADRRSPASFLSSWRMTTGLAAALVPLAIAGTAAASSVLVACLGVVGLALVGAALMPRQLRLVAAQRDAGATESSA